MLPISSSFIWTSVFLVCSFICVLFICLFIIIFLTYCVWGLLFPGFKVEFCLPFRFCPAKVGPVVYVRPLGWDGCWYFACFSDGQGWVRGWSCLLMAGFVLLFCLLFRRGILHRVLLVVGWCQVFYSSGFLCVSSHDLILRRVHGVTKSQTQLNDFTFTFHFHVSEKEMATHSSVLAWRIPGMAEPGGLPSVGSHRVRHDWSDLAAAAEDEMAGWHHRLDRHEFE